MLLVLVVATAVLLETRTPEPPQKVSQAEAEHLLSEAVRLAQAGDFAGLCRTISATRAACSDTLTDAGMPGTGVPQILSVRAHDNSATPTLVLQVTGQRATGQPYISDFAVIRDANHPDRVTSLTPVYWSGADFATASPCEAGKNDTCASSVDTAPPMP
ncbi:hypothetical protein L3Q67_44980 (plasmid) [Saccharothrix sp. AJ9571]|nr:hypothetical protein L3Q67_44980 [Saccharothrix sp. AJ9571]